MASKGKARIIEISIISIGEGLSHIGCKNCYLLKVEYEFEDGTTYTVGFCLDCGQEIPEWDEDENRSVLDWEHVPDFEIIEDEVDHLEAIVISHAHRDHDGAINKLVEHAMKSDKWGDLLPEIIMPPYGARMQQAREYKDLTAEPPRLEREYTVASHPKFKIFNDFIEEYEDGETWVFRIEDGFWYNADDVEILESDVVFHFFKVNHSVADSFAILIEAGGKSIIYSGDLRFHGANQSETVDFVQRIADPRLQNVDLLMLDATGADKQGTGKPEEVAIQNFLDLADRHPSQRIIGTMFSSQPKILEFLRTFGRRGDERQVVVHGGSMQDNLKWGHQYWPLSDDADFNPGSWRRYSYGRGPEVADNAIIFATGSQGEPLSALSRLLDDEYNEEMEDIYLTSDDIVVFAARTIPGNEQPVTNILKKLRDIGCTIYYPLDHDGNAPQWAREAGGENMAFEELHISGHAPRDDLQEIVDRLNPKKLMPIHAPLSHRALMADMMENPEDVLLPADKEEIVIL
ncbi:MAG: ribonuclease J [Candidatus Spechtbacterales bacterium]|nr:ribonuclease J [Candidatus Spechtbacterales bacterium]